MKLCATLVLVMATAGHGRTSDPAGAPREDWPSYGGDFNNWRFSQLDQVTPANAHRLRLKWTFEVPDAGVRGTSLQTTPLVLRGRDVGLPAHDAVMFITSPLNRVIALDAATGERIWEFAPDLAEPLKLCCSRANRGVAIGSVRMLSGRVEPRVYLGTLDARLWALHAATGEPVSGFGDGGGPQGSLAVADHEDGFSLTQAPLFIPRGKIPGGGAARGRDVVVVGIAGAEFGTRDFVTAYDARTGRKLWRFFTIPAPDEFGGDTWPTISSGPFADPYLRGGGSVWTTPAYDPSSGLLFVTIGNPGPDFDGTHRAGDNLFTDSVAALDVHTGARVWHYQEVHHDLWDYDPASPPVLFDVNGTPAVGQAGKTGFFYILDRRTGIPLFPCPETPVSSSHVIGPDGSPESASLTQPICEEGLQFVPFTRPGETSGGAGSNPPIFTPPSRGGARIEPGIGGGSEWSPVAFHPGLGLAFISGLVAPTDVYVNPERKPAPGEFRFGGVPIPLPPVAGTFTAIDVLAGNRRWQKRTGWPLVAGAVATAGGVVFFGIGAPWGGALVVVDAETGDEVHRFQTRGGVNAAPVTFLANGKQLVTVAAGGHLRYVSRLDDLLVTLELEE